MSGPQMQGSWINEIVGRFGWTAHGRGMLIFHWAMAIILGRSNIWAVQTGRGRPWVDDAPQ